MSDSIVYMKAGVLDIRPGLSRVVDSVERWHPHVKLPLYRKRRIFRIVVH